MLPRARSSHPQRPGARNGSTAGSESFIHAIHAAQRRTVPFNWHAVAAVAGAEGQATGFWGVEYPGRLNYCESCHQPGYDDFSASWYTANGGVNLERRMLQTVATGTCDAVTPSSLRAPAAGKCRQKSGAEIPLEVSRGLTSGPRNPHRARVENRA